MGEVRCLICFGIWVGWGMLWFWCFVVLFGCSGWSGLLYDSGSLGFGWVCWLAMILLFWDVAAVICFGV